MDPLVLQVSILSKIINHFLNLDLSSVLSLGPVSGDLNIEIVAPSDVGGMYKVALNNTGHVATQQPSEDKLPPLAPDTKKKRRLPTAKKFSKLPVNYKSGAESENEERRIHRKLATAISNNNVYADFEAYCSAHMCINDMLQSKENRIKSIPMIGFGSYISSLKSMSNEDKTLTKEKYSEWEIRMMNRVESMKYTVDSDSLDTIRQGQNIYYQHSMNKLPVLSIDQALHAMKTPLLAYMSVRDVFDGFFSTITNFIGCVKIHERTMVYRLASVVKGVKKWEFMDKWHDLVINMSNQLSVYMIALFRSIYFVHYQDNTYRDSFNSIPELQMLFKNIKTVINYSVLDSVLIESIEMNRPIPLTDNNKFDFYGKDAVMERIQDSGREIKEMISHQMFDEIPEDVYVF